MPKWTACAGPAPIITEDTPRQSARTPSVEDIRVNALPIPVYTAAGEVANTCIRVLSHQSEHSKRAEENGTHFYAVNWEHHGVLRDASLEANAQCLSYTRRERNTYEGAGEHVNLRTREKLSDTKELSCQNGTETYTQTGIG